MTGKHRTWLSPITGITFAAVSVTGIFMLLGIRHPSIGGVHEWVGLVFAITGLVHLIINWRVFIGYFQQRIAVVSLVVGLVLCLVLALAGLSEEPHGPRGGASHHAQPAAPPANR